jgi:hypothetical protein
MGLYAVGGPEKERFPREAVGAFATIARSRSIPADLEARYASFF